MGRKCLENVMELLGGRGRWYEHKSREGCGEQIPGGSGSTAWAEAQL
jgi:hypothetical protein